MTQVLARKWRPRTFAELVGQEHVVRALANALTGQRLHHAYLFTGTRGVGKTTLARILARCLNCETGVTAEPCGRCAACTEIDAGRFVDLIELDAASHTQVDNMRELLENALYAPTAGRYKVYIIDEVHMLSRNAFNAMLKTLEEPPEHVKFVLATTDPQKVPVTVLSRCLQFNLKQIPAPQIRERLLHVLDAEGIRCEAPALVALARAAQGSLRDSLSLLDQAIAHGGGSVTEESVHAMLGAVGQEYLYAIARALAASDGAALIAEAENMARASVSFEGALQELAALLHRVALAQVVPATLEEGDSDRAFLEELAASIAPDDLQLYYQIAVQGRADIGYAPDEFAGFTMTLMRMLAFAPGPAASGRPAAPVGRAAAPAGEMAPKREAAPAREVAPRREREPAPVREAGPAREAEVATATAKTTDPDTDWAQLLGEIKLTGMARSLAEHCELVAREATRIELKIGQAHQHLLEKQYQDRLRAALEERFGATLRLSITVADQTGSTPAAIADREQREKQAQAVAAIEKDPFVQGLVENFGARVVESTIRPLSEKRDQ